MIVPNYEPPVSDEGIAQGYKTTEPKMKIWPGRNGRNNDGLAR